MQGSIRILNKKVFFQGKVIESYPDDKPFPSELRLAKIDERFYILLHPKMGVLSML